MSRSKTDIDTSSSDDTKRLTTQKKAQHQRNQIKLIVLIKKEVYQKVDWYYYRSGCGSGNRLN